MSTLKEKARPDRLPGEFERRVFVGGQYDFMPVLRRIAAYVREVGLGKEFVPIIAYDFSIREEETIDWDLAILGQCRYAIFDLSDLGAQLVEMQEAKQKQTRIRSLVVYPVRDRLRRHEPERGKRTIYSFGLPYFGYVKLEELKEVIARFLHGAISTNLLPTRQVADAGLEQHLRTIKLLRGSKDLGKAWDYIKLIGGVLPGGMPLELVLERALIGHLLVKEASSGSGDTSIVLQEEEKKAWQIALDAAKLDPDIAELAYYRAHAKWEDGCYDQAVNELQRVGALCPRDSRFSFLLGFYKWTAANKRNAVDQAILQEVIGLTENALAEGLDDPLAEINAKNNLAFFYCEMASKVLPGEKAAEYICKALEYSEGLPAYHKLFGATHPYWLDTRAWAALLKAKDVKRRGGNPDTVIEALAEALQLARQAEQLVTVGEDKDITERCRDARVFKVEAAQWLRSEATKLQTAAWKTLQRKVLSKAQRYSSVADEFDLDPRITSRVERHKASLDGRVVSALIELDEVLKVMPGSEKPAAIDRVGELLENVKKEITSTS